MAVDAWCAELADHRPIAVAIVRETGCNNRWVLQEAAACPPMSSVAHGKAHPAATLLPTLQTDLAWNWQRLRGTREVLPMVNHTTQIVFTLHIGGILPYARFQPRAVTCAILWRVPGVCNVLAFDQV